MQYMFLIYLSEGSLSEEEYATCYRESAAYALQLRAHGKRVMVSPLQPTSTATSIQTREGKRILMDGPFAETREQLGGFFLLDADNLDEAIEIASKIPAAHWGTVEIRPLLQIPGLPQN
jgi:hypothetical protein